MISLLGIFILYVHCVYCVVVRSIFDIILCCVAVTWRLLMVYCNCSDPQLSVFLRDHSREFGTQNLQVFPTKRDRAGSNLSNGDSSAAAAAVASLSLNISQAGDNRGDQVSTPTAIPLGELCDYAHIVMLGDFLTLSYLQYAVILQSDIAIS